MKKAILLSLCGLLLASPLRAADFYEGKTITIIIGFTPGGTFDQIARFYARNLPKFIPGRPNIVVQNMPGAGSLVAAVHLGNVANRDGTVLGVVGGGTVLEPILGNAQARYDPRRFTWLGGLSRDTFMCTTWHSSGIHGIEAAKSRSVIVGSTGTGSRTMTFPTALNQLVGTQFKIVTGYPGGNELTMALERGETEGYCGWAISSIRQRSASWLKDNKLRFLAQFALKKDPAFPDVPLAMDLPQTAEGKRAVEFISSDAVIAWPLLAPPSVPAAQVQILRKAFDAMLQDKDVLADAGKEGLAVDPVSGSELASVVERLYETPANVLEIVKAINQAR